MADFCFPLGVPVVSCKPHEVEALQGAVVSQWSIDAEKLIKHTLAVRFHPLFLGVLPLCLILLGLVSHSEPADTRSD